MGLTEQVGGLLEQVERNLCDFGDRVGRGRIDLMLSTLRLLGIRESLPREEADYALGALEDVEDIDGPGENPRIKISGE
ncbi:hypothetical protein AC482_04095 [miscellaneous Crenarchaeota group-15 archaeon DG-45]|uniref:Uncharacterized protein n=1 Tax=miscellaneous Crenarchaeota group-15 archaeon DG-45 TaxID=1685127 RepID=A0A0M0BPV6_9ARCH|nr:MAG: hypothetical protein AC482_04095 [miscellaneous Crenarchaeota group-15 archaeon DG-45]